MAASLAERSAFIRYAVTAAVIAVAVALHWAIQPLVGSRIPFLFFLPALLLTAMLVGRGPAVIVLVAGVVNAMFLLPPVGNPLIVIPEDRVAIAAYLAVGTLLVFAGTYFGAADRRARDAERRLALAQENTGVGLFEIDLGARSMFASATLRKLFGRDPQGGDFRAQMPLDDWNALLRPEELREARAVLKRKVAEGAEGYETEHRVTLPDGSERSLFTKIHIERDAAGRAARLRGASVDITESKRVRELLEKTQGELTQQVADLRRLHELSSRLLEIGDLRSQLRAILDALAAFHGCGQGLVSLYDEQKDALTLEASVGFSAAALRQLARVAPGDGACGLAFGSSRRTVVEDTESDPAFLAWRGIARQENFRAVHSTPLISAEGRVIGVISVHFRQPRRPDERETRLADICARKAAVFVERARARDVAHESEQRFRVALESSAIPFTVLAPVRDEGGTIVDFQWLYMNNAGATVLRQDAAALAGRRVLDVLPGHWDPPGLLDHYVTAAETGRTQEFEAHSEASGAGVWYHVIISPMRDALAVWFADITERKQNEQALRDADRRKDEFLATLAHELRNPLAPIRQAAMISKAPGATEAQKSWSHDVIERQVAHMALLLDDLLDVSRITRGMLQLRKARTDLCAVVNAAIETARPLIDARQHRLLVDLPPYPVQFEADQLRVAQVVANLLTNAAKYTDNGGVIRLAAEARGEEVTITVSDNGIGLREDALSEIFKMFNQVRATQDRSNGGLGIGLALARGLVELHGGSIDAASAGPGRGSSFTVRLPVRADLRAADAGVVVPVRSTVKRRVLVVDDNRDAADTLAEFLQLEGHEVRVAYDGEAGLAQFAAFRPDTALLDIGMPRLNGNEVARHIRGLPEGAGAMLIAVTGWGQDKDKQRAQEAGFDHHLTKPIDLHRLALLLTEPSAAVLAEAARHA
ncbi:MAG TPA: ATP-binding protein [Noviherbaspirillum sp.]|uniref:ATP-binding protein n=1 Tax=Noviherbaspirillum sp. TaxID=1926288 RepID=UPI002D5A6FF7|nr:ATP-binding protein [Noviherbaspirillum sp.]HYD93840.1 ATP-binding protein [Noviherbaspirillum sp.]